MDRLPPPRRRFAFPRGLKWSLILAVSATWAPLWTAGAEAVVVVAAGSADQEIVESKGSYESQGKTIAIERFEPKAPGRYPAVLVVHGAGGTAIGGPWFRDSARMLARRGYVAHVVHYFDVSGTRIADMPAMRAHFPAWMRALADGVSNASQQPNVDPERVGMLGYSLGSYLSLSLSMFDTRVLAVVEYFGGLPDVLVKDVKSLPPTLILHGDSDLVVPVSQAKALEVLCKQKKVVYEMRIYPGQGHGFLGAPNLDATRLTLEFFETHVKTAPPAVVRREPAVAPELNLFAASGGKPGGGK